MQPKIRLDCDRLGLLCLLASLPDILRFAYAYLLNEHERDEQDERMQRPKFY